MLLSNSERAGIDRTMPQLTMTTHESAVRSPRLADETRFIDSQPVNRFDYKL